MCRYSTLPSRFGGHSIGLSPVARTLLRQTGGGAKRNILPLPPPLTGVWRVSYWQSVRSFFVLSRGSHHSGNLFALILRLWAGYTIPLIEFSFSQETCLGRFSVSWRDTLSRRLTSRRQPANQPSSIQHKQRAKLCQFFLQTPFCTRTSTLVSALDRRETG